jgi:hypothetical protein
MFRNPAGLSGVANKRVSAAFTVNSMRLFDRNALATILTGE